MSPAPTKTSEAAVAARLGEGARVAGLASVADGDGWSAAVGGSSLHVTVSATSSNGPSAVRRRDIGCIEATLVKRGGTEGYRRAVGHGARYRERRCRWDGCSWRDRRTAGRTARRAASRRDR